LPFSPQKEPVTGNLGFCGYLLTIISIIVLFMTAPISLFFCIKIVKEYERAVIFRLGRLIPGGARGPGMNLEFCICEYPFP
jgi:erythrocyte band 7 integral membrane protein